MWRGLTPVTPQSADLAPSPHLQQVGEANWVDIYSFMARPAAHRAVKSSPCEIIGSRLLTLHTLIIHLEEICRENLLTKVQQRKGNYWSLPNTRYVYLNQKLVFVVIFLLCFQT